MISDTSHSAPAAHPPQAAPDTVPAHPPQAAPDTAPLTIAQVLATLSPAPSLPPALAATPVRALAHDSRAVTPGTLFFAITGLAADGHAFVPAAFAAGAAACVVQHPVAGLDSLPQILVADTRAALAAAAAAFYGNPSQSVQVTGVTGTNGKTTTVYLLESIARAAGQRTGLISTVETRVGESVQPSERTTPDALALQALFARARAAGVTRLAMEVSSHAIDLRRVDDVSFAAVAFTNLTQDHLDYHGDMAAYRAVKKRLFVDFDARARVINIDDSVGAELAAELTGAGYEVVTVGRAGGAVVRAIDCVAEAAGSRFTLVTPDGAVAVALPLAGDYNVSNALVAAGCAWACGTSLDAIAAGLSQAPQVPGRLERVEAGQDFTVVVDYAHTPDALVTALAALRGVCAGRLLCVFGCGGDRDASKRAVMGRAAGAGADTVIVTSDNPRSEDPAAIVAAVAAGVTASGAACEVLVDRRAAIARALALAKSGDCVLIAGKGHEDYQIFADRTVHFDDREVARAVLDDLLHGGSARGAAQPDGSPLGGER